MWSDDYPDALPPVTYIGIGSPTGVKFGTHSNFPEKYQRASFVADWSGDGRILAVHLTATGASYRGKWEPFVQGTPLNLTSIAFGPDGALYFVTGGRGTQSGLYRVSYTGAPVAGETNPADAPALSARKIRHALEAFHTKEHANPAQLAVIETQLLSPDRSVQFAARVALEHQDPPAWVPAKLEPETRLDELLPVARVDQGTNFLHFISSYVSQGDASNPPSPTSAWSN